MKQLNASADKLFQELCSGNLVEITLSPEIVIDGAILFLLHDQHGIQLMDTLHIVMQRGLIVDWHGWIKAGIKSTWMTKRVLSSIIYACRETGYGKDYLHRQFKIRTLTKG